MSRKIFLDVFGIDLHSAGFDIYGLTGLGIVETLAYFPTAFLLLVGVLSSIDPVLENAARSLGASGNKIAQKRDPAACIAGNSGLDATPFCRIDGRFRKSAYLIRTFQCLIRAGLPSDNGKRQSPRWFRPCDCSSHSISGCLLPPELPA